MDRDLNFQNERRKRPGAGHGGGARTGSCTLEKEKTQGRGAANPAMREWETTGE